MDLNGKNVVYIGGFGGIGLATCKVIATKGVKHLIILDTTLNAEALQQLQHLNVNTHFIAFDITKSLNDIRKTIKDILKKFKTIDVLVNGAGIANESIEMIPKMIKINFEGPINVTIAVMENVDRRHGGKGGLSIVNICSTTALNPLASMAVYGATKAGLLGFSKSCAKLFDQTGITVFAVCPGVTTTNLLHTDESFMGGISGLRNTLEAIPKQTPEQCAENIVDVIEKNQNGAVWVLDMGHIALVEEQQIWNIPEELK